MVDSCEGSNEPLISMQFRECFDYLRNHIVPEGLCTKELVPWFFTLRQVVIL